MSGLRRCSSVLTSSVDISPSASTSSARNVSRIAEHMRCLSTYLTELDTLGLNMFIEKGIPV